MLLGGKSKQEALESMQKCWNELAFALANTDNPLGNALKNDKIKKLVISLYQ